MSRTTTIVRLALLALLTGLAVAGSAQPVTNDHLTGGTGKDSLAGGSGRNTDHQ